MRITPLDIRNQPFPRAFRGFDPYAVKNFLEHIAGEYEAIIRQNNEFATQLKCVEQQLEKYAGIERVLNETLITAQKSSDVAKVNAQREAELIIREAQARADRYKTESEHKVNLLESEAVSIRNQRDSFLARFKAMLTTQLSLLEVISGDLRSDDPQERLPAPQQERPQYRQPPSQRLPAFGDDDTLDIDDVPPQPVILA